MTSRDGLHWARTFMEALLRPGRDRLNWTERNVELQDAAGDPLPGYTLAECDEIYGDEIERVVTWNGSADLAQWAGQPVRLGLALRDADVYALRFQG